jgi:hypothetical protein
LRLFTKTILLELYEDQQKKSTKSKIFSRRNSNPSLCEL